MGKTKKKKDKTLSIGKKLIAIMLLSCSLVGLGFSVGFSFQNIYSLGIAVPAGIIAFISLLILLKDYKIEKKGKTATKTTKWYVDKFFVALVPVWVLSAIILISTGYDENETIMYAGFLMFPVISILIAPNAVFYALKDMKGWKRIFTGNGNLDRFKDNEDFYTVKVPVSFEKRLFLAVVRDQILNINAAVAVMVIAAVCGLISILTYDSHSVSPGNVIGAIFYVRVRRGTGYMAFILLLVLVFGFPLFVYYITNAIYKLRTVAKHKYIAYHAIVKNVNTYKMIVDCDGRHYEYKFGTLVGMREKHVKDTPAVLIFIPDDVFIFPDKTVKTKSVDL